MYAVQASPLAREFLGAAGPLDARVPGAAPAAFLGSCSSSSNGSSITSVGRRRSNGASPVVAMSSSSSGGGSPRVAAAASTPTTMAAPSKPYLEGDLPAPAWAGEQPLSKIFNLLIHGPIYPLLKLGARSSIIGDSEKNGVPWRAMAAELDAANAELEKEKQALEKDLNYPDYYLKPFHAYEKGNLCWEAAYEVEAATLRLYQRAIPWVNGDILEGEHVFRQSWLDAIQDHLDKHSPDLKIDTILDIGCSVGVSTRLLARAFPTAQVTGLDASPYFLAVASYRGKQLREAAEKGREGITSFGPVIEAGAALQPNPKRRSDKGPKDDPALRIEWVHGLGEDTGLPDACLSMVSLAFVVHECPAYAIRNLAKEARRILKKGGIVVITDNSPKSKVIQSIPAPLAAFMKSTEPHSDSYYLCDLNKVLQEEGFANVTSVLSDPRHRVVTATAA